MAKPKMRDEELQALAFGKIKEDGCSALKEDIKKLLRIQDEQDAINRYVWADLPNGITGQMVERMLYYRGQLCFFYLEALDSFFMLPYTLDGTIDCYGRFVDIKPLPFNGKADADFETVDGKKTEVVFIPGLTLRPIYEFKDLSAEEIMSHCVILRDYTEQLSQKSISRQILNDPLLDAMAEAFPYARTAMIASTGVRGLRTSDEGSSESVLEAGKSIQKAAQKGNLFVPVFGPMEFQDLSGRGNAAPDTFLQYFQALDNFRLSLYGLKNGGVFEKKTQMLDRESRINESDTLITYMDGLHQRQRFCMLANSLFGTTMWCYPSEAVVGDMNMDGENGIDAVDPVIEEGSEDAIQELD